MVNTRSNNDKPTSKEPPAEPVSKDTSGKPSTTSTKQQPHKPSPTTKPDKLKESPIQLKDPPEVQEQTKKSNALKADDDSSQVHSLPATPEHTMEPEKVYKLPPNTRITFKNPIGANINVNVVDDDDDDSDCKFLAVVPKPEVIEESHAPSLSVAPKRIDEAHAPASSKTSSPIEKVLLPTLSKKSGPEEIQREKRKASTMLPSGSPTINLSLKKKKECTTNQVNKCKFCHKTVCHEIKYGEFCAVQTRFYMKGKDVTTEGIHKTFATYYTSALRLDLFRKYGPDVELVDKLNPLPSCMLNKSYFACLNEYRMM